MFTLVLVLKVTVIQKAYCVRYGARNAEFVLGHQVRILFTRSIRSRFYLVKKKGGKNHNLQYTPTCSLSEIEFNTQVSGAALFR